MKDRIKYLLLLAAALFIGGCGGKQEPEPEVEFDLFLMLGQSNMVGYAPLEPQDSSPIRGVWLLDGEGNMVPASSPMNRFSTIRFMGQTYYGLGASFAKKVRHDTGHYILLISNARGGSAIAEWKKGGPYNFYDEAVRRTRQALEIPGVHLKGILWHQGEADCTRADFEDYWYSHFCRMINDFRADFSNPALPVVIGQTYEGASYASLMNPVMEKVCEKLEFSDWASSEGCTDLGDRIHFSREGYDILGERYAEKILELCY